jgi:hypothetical protein
VLATTRWSVVSERFGPLTRRDGWEREERRRIEAALAEARHWQCIEPHKTGFWTTFWGGMLEVQYPDWKWRRQPQTGLAEFGGGESA